MKATAFAIVLILPYSWAASIPRTYYVSPTGSATYPFSTAETAATVIQDAVDAAQYGDVVQLLPGEYRQRVVLRPGVRFWGSGPDSTTVVALEEGFAEVAVRGAEEAEIRGIGFLRAQSGLAGSPYAIGLGPYPAQVVAHCAIRGPFHLGVAVGGPGEGAPAVIYDCTFEGPGCAVAMADSARAAVDLCSFRGVSFRPGGFVLITRCTFTRAQLFAVRGDILMDSCLFADTEGYSAYVSLDGTCSFRMTNCIMWGKVSGVIVNSAENVEIYNSTFVNDDSAIRCDPAVKVVLRNSILWGPPGQCDGMNPASFDVAYCDVAGGREGEGNIDADPLFVDAEKGDFRLRPHSPCIDSGVQLTPAWLPGGDFAGNPRPLYGGREAYRQRRSDIGAYEYYINQISPGPVPGEATLTWSCTFYETYSVFYSDDLVTWRLADFGVGPGVNEAVLSWTDDGSLTGLPPLLAPKRFYRVLENP